VSLLVTIFIQPILRFTWSAVLAVGGFLHKGYVDRIYVSAARGVSELSGSIMVTALFVAIPMAAVYSLLHGRGSDFDSQIATRALRTAWRLMAAFTALTLFVLFTISTGTRVITESFIQRLTVLAPAISDTEFKTLKAKWASMQGKADYDALVIAMDKRATELSVTLPPVRNP
jgi:hypothetical protein